MSVSNEPVTQLTGLRISLTRGVWVAVVLLNLVLFAFGIPAEYQSRLDAALRFHQPALANLGLSVGFYAVYRTLMDVTLMAAFTLTGAIFFWRKSRDWMVMLVSLASITFGALFVPTLIQLVEIQPVWKVPVAFVRAAGLGLSLVVFYYLFPDGRFVPRWTRWLAALWGILTVIWFLFPQAPFNLVYLDTWMQNLGPSFAILLFWMVTGVVAQIYRYRRVSGPIQRQQTKWVVFGTTGAVIGFILYHLPLIIFPGLRSPGVPGLLHTFFGVPIYHLFILLVPVSLGISISRYRLWDIDFLINRSLVYSIVSAMLALVYFGSVVFLQQAFNLISERRPTLVVITSTLATAALFNPLRSRVQNWIDRRFYRRKYDAAQTLSKLTPALRDEVDLTRLTEHLEAAVWETMRPSHILTWLRTPSGYGVHLFLNESEAIYERVTAEIAFTDPLVEYFHDAPGVVDLSRIHLPSPGLKRLKSANVKMIVPLVFQGELLGWLSLGPRANGREYSADDREVLAKFGIQAAPAVRVAQLAYQEQLEALERERIEHELQVARLIQQTLLPDSPPVFDGWQAAAYYGPAQAVGGDFYDFLVFDDGRLGIVIGDVTDKGIPAALLMATTRSILRSVALGGLSPGEVLERVNELLIPDMPENMFVTCQYAILDPSNGAMRFANAGHNLPVRHTKEGVAPIHATGMPLGLISGMKYEERELVVAPGECLLFYSDGLVEAHNPDHEMFGSPRLEAVFRERVGHPALIECLLEELRSFTGEAWEQEDDVTMVMIRRLEGNRGLSSD